MPDSNSILPPTQLVLQQLAFFSTNPLEKHRNLRPYILHKPTIVFRQRLLFVSKLAPLILVCFHRIQALGKRRKAQAGQRKLLAVLWDLVGLRDDNPCVYHLGLDVLLGKRRLHEHVLVAQKGLARVAGVFLAKGDAGVVDQGRGWGLFEQAGAAD